MFLRIIPPFQSPDEFDHVKRAYMLSRGVFFLETRKGESTGGMVDTALLNFMEKFTNLPFKPLNKINREETSSASTIRWSGLETYSTAPGTGYYFPLIYTPQAIGLFVGRTLNLTVYSSYQLARTCNIAVSLALLWIAFSYWPCSPLLAALLILPMSLFQLTSACIDYTSISLTALLISIFLYISDSAKDEKEKLFYIMTFLISVISSCRLQMLPVFALVIMSCFNPFRWRKMLFGFFSLVGVLYWTLYSIVNTADLRVSQDASKVDIIFFYLNNPVKFIAVLCNTLSSRELISWYTSGLLGRLGWLDIAFSDSQYIFLLICLSLTIVLSISIKTFASMKIERFLILLASIVSIFIVFASMLIGWSKHPAQIISGVQGRYFTLPFILFSFSISSTWKGHDSIYRRIGLSLNAVFIIFAALVMPIAIIYRYYLG
nr:DUF2142 domain-containing protein [Fundidesulfovibrio terrae]